MLHHARGADPSHRDQNDAWPALACGQPQLGRQVLADATVQHEIRPPLGRQTEQVKGRLHVLGAEDEVLALQQLDHRPLREHGQRPDLAQDHVLNLVRRNQRNDQPQDSGVRVVVLGGDVTLWNTEQSIRQRAPGGVVDQLVVAEEVDHLVLEEAANEAGQFAWLAAHIGAPEAPRPLREGLHRQRGVQDPRTHLV